MNREERIAAFETPLASDRVWSPFLQFMVETAELLVDISAKHRRNLHLQSVLQVFSYHVRDVIHGGYAKEYSKNQISETFLKIVSISSRLDTMFQNVEDLTEILDEINGMNDELLLFIRENTFPL